jgi:hypothetical protein
MPPNPGRQAMAPINQWRRHGVRGTGEGCRTAASSMRAGLWRWGCAPVGSRIRDQPLPFPLTIWYPEATSTPVACLSWERDVGRQGSRCWMVGNRPWDSEGLFQDAATWHGVLLALFVWPRACHWSARVLRVQWRRSPRSIEPAAWRCQATPSLLWLREKTPPPVQEPRRRRWATRPEEQR